MKKAALLIFGIVLVMSLLASGCGSPNPEEFTEPPSEKTAEGYYVYYVVRAALYENYLAIKTTEKYYVTVVDIEKNLTVVVNEKYGGTVLIARHWTDNVINHVDSAELIVRTQEQKEIWESEIQKQIERYQKKQPPRDVLPWGYEPP